MVVSFNYPSVSCRQELSSKELSLWFIFVSDFFFPIWEERGEKEGERRFPKTRLFVSSEGRGGVKDSFVRIGYKRWYSTPSFAGYSLLMLERARHAAWAGLEKNENRSASGS